MDKVKKRKSSKKTAETINNGKCLLIEIDNRKIFTNKKNIKYLVDMSKKINAILQIVQVENATLIPLQEIHNNINNTSYISPEYKYEIIKNINETLPNIVTQEQVIIETSQTDKIHITESKEIRSIIRFALLKGEPITNNDLFNLLHKFNLSKNKARYYINYVKKTMAEEGYEFKK